MIPRRQSYLFVFSVFDRSIFQIPIRTNCFITAASRRHGVRSIHDFHFYVGEPFIFSSCPGIDKPAKDFAAIYYMACKIALLFECEMYGRVQRIYSLYTPNPLRTARFTSFFFCAQIGQIDIKLDPLATTHINFI